MLGVSKSVFVYSIINCITVVALVSIRELPTDDIIVNINKGYALQRIGTYSTNMVEEVVDTFLSLDNFCAVQTTNAVCKYTSSSPPTNIIELATIITSDHIRDISFSYDRDNVSQLIAKDLNRVLNNNAAKLSPATTSINAVDNNNNNNNILQFRPTSVDMIIK
ncbi:unnamed protein product [Rotaria sp. Silwood2]|nr:unnamed protein product [Rotaria sp. Silwood2]